MSSANKLVLFTKEYPSYTLLGFKLYQIWVKKDENYDLTING